MGLLTHENVDIVIDVVELIYELTDEDAEIDYEEDDYEKSEEAMSILVDALVSHSTVNSSPLTIAQVENQALDLLVDNLARLNESDEADRQGVFHVLGIANQRCQFLLALQPYVHRNIRERCRVQPGSVH